MCATCLGVNSYRCPDCGIESGIVTCPDCYGTGGEYWALSVDNDTEEVVTHAAYVILPDSRERALMMRFRWYKGYFEPCRRCGGTGEIEADEWEPDPDEYHDRLMKQD